MLEQEFEKDKQKMLSLLPDYLSSKGINVGANFTCLNPDDKAHIPTMTYVKDKNIVSCFHCKNTYNIFDLIGIEYNLPTFAQQFTKAHELFIGSVPLGYIEILKKQALAQLNPSKGFSKPTFEITQDRQIVQPTPPFGGSTPQVNHAAPVQRETVPSFGFADQNDLQQMPERRESISFNTISPFDEARLRPFNQRVTSAQNSVQQNMGNNGFAAQNQNPGQLNQTARSPFSFSDVSNGTPRFGESQNTVFQNYTPDNTSFDFTDYINQCANNVSKSTYFTSRGLSESVIHRFKLGIDEHFQAELDSLAPQRYWKAAIIPYGIHGYCVRNTESSVDEKRDRYKKKGIFDIFNHEALEQPGTIFITEGEFDALSIETLGCRAIALGGASNIRQLIEAIRECKEEHTYYICLDNDEAGMESTKQIAAQLYQLKINAKIINLAHPYKDINEALCKAPEGLRNRVANLDKILSFSLESLTRKEPETRYILSSQDLQTLSLSAALYTMTAKPQVLRRLVSDIIKNRQQAIVYASSRPSRNYLSRFLTEGQTVFDASEWNALRFLEIGEDDIDSKIFSGIESQILQGNSSFVTIVDLCSLSEDKVDTTLTKLNNLCQVNGVCLIALCSEGIRAKAEGVSIQNLEIDVNEQGDYVVNTLDNLCRKVSFVCPKL